MRLRLQIDLARPQHLPSTDRFSVVFIAPLVGFLVLSSPWSVFAGPLTGDLLVQSQAPGTYSYRVCEYIADGTILQTFPVEHAPGTSDLRHPCDLVANERRGFFLYAGSSDPYLGTYDAVTATWDYRTHPGWSSINDIACGGIAAAGDYVFVTDMATGGGPSQGIVAFDMAHGTAVEFATSLFNPIDITLGLDGHLWVLSGNVAHAFNPTTLESLGSVALGNTGGNNSALAVDRSGDFFVATRNGFVAHLDAEGTLLDTLEFGPLLVDIDVAQDGRLAVGTSSAGAWLSDTSLDDAQQIESGRWNAFVAFVPVPSPAPLTIVHSSDGLQLHWPGQIDWQYVPQCSVDMRDWTNWGTPLFGPGRILSCTDTAPVGHRFYRVDQRETFTIDLSRLHYDVLGQYRDYQVVEDDDGVVSTYSESLDIVRTSTQNGYEVFEMESRTNGVWNGTTFLAQSQTSALLEVGGIDPEDGEYFYSPPNEVLYNTFKPGESVTSVFGDSEFGSVTQQVSMAVAPIATTVPAGTFDSVIRVDSFVAATYRGFAITMDVAEWYVLDVGLVKSRSTISIPDIPTTVVTRNELVSHGLR